MNDDDPPNYPNTARYWRLNSLMALRECRDCESQALDPEHLEQIKADHAEFAQLQNRENAVKARYNRLINSRRLTL
jgi:hypothetical protein